MQQTRDRNAALDAIETSVALRIRRRMMERFGERLSTRPHKAILSIANNSRSRDAEIAR
jgi:hypothetical protein